MLLFLGPVGILLAALFVGAGVLHVVRPEPFDRIDLQQPLRARQIGLGEAEIEQALRTYPGLPHRMERVRDKHGVLFINDSKATNPASAAR